MSAIKRLGVVDALYCQPLYQRLAVDDGFTQVVDVPAAHAISLRNHTLDVAFLTPIDYARQSEFYRIVPDVGASSSRPTGSVALFFRDALHTISSVAVDPSSLSEIVLARIILAEEFDLAPKFIPVHGGFDNRLNKADAVLLSGNASLREVHQYPHFIDLVESWNDLTDLPYLHGIWCAHDGDLTSNEVHTLQEIALRGVSSLPVLADELHSLSTFPFASPKAFRTYWDAFSFLLTDEDLRGLGEFLRYAFYHGVLQEVADVHLWTPPTIPSPTDISPN